MMLRLRSGRRLASRSVRRLSTTASQAPKQPRSLQWVGVGAATVGIGAASAYSIVGSNEDYKRSANAVISLGRVLTDVHGAKEALSAATDIATSSNVEERATSILAAIANDQVFRKSLVDRGGLDVFMDTCKHTSEPKLQERIVHAIAELANTPGADEVFLDIEKSSYLALQMTSTIVHRQPHDPKPVAITPLDAMQLYATFSRIRQACAKNTAQPIFRKGTSEAIFDRLGKVVTGVSTPELKLLVGDPCAPRALGSDRSHDLPSETNPQLKLHAAKLLTIMLRNTLHPVAPKYWCQEVAKWARDPSPEMQLLSAECLHVLAKKVPDDVLKSSAAQDALLHMARLHRQAGPSSVALQLEVSNAVHALADVLQTSLHTTVEAPMSKLFEHLDDLPVLDAKEYDALPEFGWVDVLSEWALSANPSVCANAIQSLSHLALRESTGHHFVLQAWMMSLLRQLGHAKSINAQSRRAVAEVESLANMTQDQTPGQLHVAYSPLVMETGLGALAVLVDEPQLADMFTTHGGLELVALAAIKSTAAVKSQCARILANLAITRPSVARQVQDVLGGALFTQELLHWSEEPNVMVRSNYFRAATNFASTAGQKEEDRVIYREGVHPIVGRIPSHATHSPPVDVVFIHGLRGHPFGTWRTDMVSGDMERRAYVIWPEAFLLHDLSPESRLVTLGYDAGMVTWSSPWPALTLEERAKLMLKGLEAAQIGTHDRPVVFVTHSLGGLLAKEMLVVAAQQGKPLVENTAGVVFMAVPHFGANLSSLNNDTLRALVQAHPATKDLNVNSSRLLALHTAFQNLKIPSLSLAEGRPAPLGLGVNHMIVMPESADPRGGEGSAFHLLLHAHHMDICKPPTKKDSRYSLVRDFIATCIAGKDNSKS
ncbi:hypothetical protein Ae201684P_013015 [Aphanomyces euteiches]|nr:hypothetical protein Ae201684P_013015 [Aphanomyces euteiches]